MPFFYPELPSPDWVQTEGARIKRLLIHCWAPWNGYDFQLHNHLASIQQQLAGAEVRLRSLDIDNEAFWPFLKEHRVRIVPGLLLFSDGKLVKSSIGAAPPDEILKLLGLITDT